ncbi:hypothetical protein [Sulfitobacter sp. DSM 110093]|uniref:hypothetical protein n=1 Tax=Sulfitobacter sp. DSM 110093 TaxID=2883127 RepID=UPI001FACB758|nr:hypothetical protein [Sulfitobacter sp. DSM 110093]
MPISSPLHLPLGGAYPISLRCPPLRGRFQLTRADRIGIERLLSLGLTAACPNPILIEGFLRHKLRLARPAPDQPPTDLVVAGRRVTYMTSGTNARSGKLTMVSDSDKSCVPVTSFLGATLLGMRKMQKMPLLCRFPRRSEPGEQIISTEI